MSPPDDIPSTRRDAHEDIEFLAGSRNRLAVLMAVTETPRTRNELKEKTDVSRVTLSRILADLEDRSWIDREANRIEATTAGTVVASEASRLLDNLAAVNELEDALEWLPIEQFDFELEHLRDVSVIRPGQQDFTAPTRKLVDLAYECSRVRGIPTGITHEFIAALRDATVNGDLTLEFLLPPDVLEIVSNDPELRRQFLDIVDSGNAEVFHYLGDSTPIMLGILDEHVMVCGHGNGDVPPGTIETTNDAIRSWAESYFRARCAEARRLEPEAFTA